MTLLECKDQVARDAGHKDWASLLAEYHDFVSPYFHDKVSELFARSQMELFRDWYDNLSPAGKCTVWPPAGSGSGTGLYNMTTADLVDKFIRRKI